MNVLPPHDLVNWLLTPSNLWTLVGLLAGAMLIVTAIKGLLRSRATGESAQRGKRKVKLEDVTSRWQLMLLGTTAFLLSLASGYRVWDGMSNFTGETYLSLMVTFGIQGVMLITAWLIGESFASGMNHKLADGRRAGRLDAPIGIAIAFVAVATVFYFVLQSFGVFSFAKNGAMKDFHWDRFADISVYFALGLVVLGVLAFNFSRGGEVSVPYVQSARIIAKNAMLWVMFLACMSTAVFFSFDSLFGAIFPKDERARAAQLRAQNQVSGMVADIGTTIDRRRLDEIRVLFSADNGWSKYDSQLTSLAKAAQGSQGEIERFFNKQIEDKNTAIKQQQERIASAQSGTAGLSTRKTTLLDELNRLKGERPGLASDFAEKKTELENRAKGVDAKRVEAQAEDRGAEGTLKQGKGPMYRQIMSDLARLQDAYKIQDERVRDSQKRLTSVDTRIAQIERELAAVDGDLAKLKGEASTAEQRIKLTEEQTAGDGQPRIDPSRVLPAFERARLDFRQEPTRERLAALQQQCTQLYAAMAGTPATKGKVAGIDCDPKQATEAAQIMFQLNDGQKTFETTCVGGDKLAAQTSTDALYGFARKCLADSGLPAKETDELRSKINFLELTRDDKAHPFVASLNAFQDGNRLAYLSLAIAIGMESLVFMAGLFGANAVRSPLSDVPSSKARSGRQLESIMENALLPNVFESARNVLNAMRPMAERDGFTARVVIEPGDPHAPDIRRVLNAAATIGAVRQIELRDEIYEVRSELFEFLSVVAKKAFEADDEHARIAELRQVVSVALQPYVGDHADIVISHCRPITERNGFSAEIYLDRMAADDSFVVQKVLNAGATLNYVQNDDRDGQDQRFYVHKQLYKTLLLIASVSPRTGQRSGAPMLAGPSSGRPALGGTLDSSVPALGLDGGVRGAPQLSHTPEDAGAGAEAPKNVPPQPVVQALTDAQFAELKYRFSASMVEALGVSPDVYLSIGGDVFGAAVATSEAFRAVQRSNRMFDRIIEDRERAAQGAVDQMYERLASQAARHGAEGGRALDDAYNEVLGNLPLIALLPGGPVERDVASIRQQLEEQFQSDNGRLSVEEEDLLRLVRRLGSQFAASGRQNADDWRRLHAGLQGPFAVYSNGQAGQPRRA